ncbi:MAG: hypothetical protein PHT99_03310 [Methanoregula sp.]|nr:hypothetical protein [Methanoregula sp.]
MLPEPDQSPLDPEDILWFSYDWCSLPWTEWVPFNATKQVFNRILREPGLYRIRPVGKDYLVYIGETKRSLRERLQNLRIELAKAEGMPWSDPHAEAPALWAYQVERRADHHEEMRRTAEHGPAPETGSAGKGTADEPSRTEEGLLPVDPCGFECSAAPLDASASGRRGMESFLLYRYRQEYGASPLCSLGRFHPRYRRSTTRKEGFRGGKLAEGQKDNPAGSPGLPPLCPKGAPGDRDWMGLSWSTPARLAEESLSSVPGSQGLYLLSDAVSGEILFIGSSGNCAGQLAEQSARGCEGKEIAFSYHAPGNPVLPHQLRELETDLIGNFFEQYRKAPEKQFRNSR